MCNWYNNPNKYWRFHEILDFWMTDMVSRQVADDMDWNEEVVSGTDEYIGWNKFRLSQL